MASKNRLSTKIILLVEAILLITSILFCTVSIFRARIGIRKAIQQRMLELYATTVDAIRQTLTTTEMSATDYNDPLKLDPEADEIIEFMPDP